MKKVYNLPLDTDVADSRQVNEPRSDSKAWNIFFAVEQFLRLYCMFLQLWQLVWSDVFIF